MYNPWSTEIEFPFLIMAGSWGSLWSQNSRTGPLTEIQYVPPWIKDATEPTSDEICPHVTALPPSWLLWHQWPRDGRMPSPPFRTLCHTSFYQSLKHRKVKLELRSRISSTADRSLFTRERKRKYWSVHCQLIIMCLLKNPAVMVRTER